MERKQGFNAALREELGRGISPAKSREKCPAPGRSGSPFSGTLRRKKSGHSKTSPEPPPISRSGNVRRPCEMLTPLMEGPDTAPSSMCQWMKGRLTRTSSVSLNGKSGLLVHIEDSHLIRVQSNGEDAVFCETTTNSSIHDYRSVEGIMVAHSGRSVVTLFCFGDVGMSHARISMEEAWKIEEVAYNIPGLSADCFIPPADLSAGGPLTELSCGGGSAKSYRDR